MAAAVIDTEGLMRVELAVPDESIQNTRAQEPCPEPVPKTEREPRAEYYVEQVEREFLCAEQMGRGEILPRGFVHLETLDEDPMLVRCAAVTSVEHSGKDSRTIVSIAGHRISVRGSYEATIAKLFATEVEEHTK